MVGKRKQNPVVTQGRIVKIEGKTPFVEDEFGNRYDIKTVDFLHYLLSGEEGDVQHYRPFVYSSDGGLKIVGVVFPIIFRNNNVQQPMALPVGRIGLSDDFENFNVDYSNYDNIKSIRKNANRTILKTLDSEGNIQKQILITDGETELGQLNINITRAGKVTIDLLNASGDFSADLALNADGKADVSIKGDANILINGNSNLSIDGNITLNCGGNSNLTIEGDVNLTANGKVDLISDSINLGGNQQFKIALAEMISNLFNAHTHLSASPGSPTSPPLQPMTAQQIGSGKHTVDQ